MRSLPHMAAATKAEVTAATVVGTVAAKTQVKVVAVAVLT